MQVRFLLGPAGSGKTYGCLSEARQALAAAPEGSSLIFLAPKQGTYQLEQQLLSGPDLAGYTRLSIVSFESLARLILDRVGRAGPAVLTEQGQVMVLRALLSQQRDTLKLYRASARLTGFAQQLGAALRELQRAGLDAAALTRVAAGLENEGLKLKLQDLAVLLKEYRAWLEAHELEDEEAVLQAAAACLHEKGATFGVGALWVDGFAEFSRLELELLAALLPCCDRATLTFCLEAPPSRKLSWLSHWSSTGRAFESCRKRFATLPNFSPAIELLAARAPSNRFSQNPVFQYLRDSWDSPQSIVTKSDRVKEVVAQVQCADREAEALVAAREILKFVRSGGRYRDVAVLVRNLELYYQVVQRIFGRYGIPFFLDRREPVAHHPLSELTRSALRVVAFGWQQEDWFAALKSGLAGLAEDEMDLLENEALARGWKGRVWLEPLELKESARSAQDAERLQRLGLRLEKIRQAAIPPFEKLAKDLAAARNRPTGPQLASALREFWQDLQVQQQLQNWSDTRRTQGAWQPDATLHETVWNQMTAWLENAELAFAHEALSLREWLPILEAGLAALTVGIIPPALDQVLVGAVDRSRTPEVKLAVVLGLNEGIFPAKPQSGSLLTEADRLELERNEVSLGDDARRQLARERYLGYIACTRARQRLVLTWASVDGTGAPLNPSALVSHITRLFPGLLVEQATAKVSPLEAQHTSELVTTLLRDSCSNGSSDVSTPRHTLLPSVPGLAGLIDGLSTLSGSRKNEVLTPELVQRLYGSTLRTSVSRMEQFAACPFKFFVHSGLRAEERKRFDLDVKEQGTFQHEVLAMFHQLLREQGKQWRDIAPEEGRALIGKIAAGLMAHFRQGLLQSSEQARFTARVLTESLQDFVEVVLLWMREQYQFDPVAVEFGFGPEQGNPGWVLDLGEGKSLELSGRIDRIDLCREAAGDRALCVVLDYKSREKQLEPVLMEHGLQLQLLTYLNVVRQWPEPERAFGVRRLEPAGVFYVSLRGRYSSEANRLEALEDPGAARKRAYRHSGRFDLSALPQLDGRSDVQQGDQFNYRLAKGRKLRKDSREAMPAAQFQTLLSGAENLLRAMGRRIYSGCIELSPYRKGSLTACDQCSYHAICRVDPWNQTFRLLAPAGQGGRTGPVPNDLEAVP